MRFLLDTNICSDYLRDDRRLFSRFIQYSGNHTASRVVLAELYAWAHALPIPQKRMEAIQILLGFVHVLEFDDECAQEYGRLHVAMRRAGRPMAAMDLMIAASARVHDLTVVTHNVRDFADVPDLPVVDWLAA